jgi:hypothetical protein
MEHNPLHSYLYKFLVTFPILMNTVQILKLNCSCCCFSGSAAQHGLWPPRSRGFVITHNDAPQSVGLIWASDQLVAKTST